ncbi:hypothetical protein [Bacillus halotolerans]|nr:hypothetical protein [Bacillus halotolerans]MBL4965761.1 hypothetical protein [Bacillus halotolerans]
MYSGYLYTYPFGGWPYGASRAYGYAFIVVLIVVLLIVGGVYWFTGNPALKTPLFRGVFC